MGLKAVGLTKQDIIKELQKHNIDGSIGKHEILVCAKLTEDSDDEEFELDICLIDGEIVIDPEFAVGFNYTLDEIVIMKII